MKGPKSLDAPARLGYETPLDFKVLTGRDAAGSRRGPPNFTKARPMARRCDLTGVGPATGHNVSHANNKTKRRFLPNLCNVTLHSDKLGQGFKFKVAASTLRTVDHVGGLDVFLSKANDAQLSPNALKVKRKLAKAS